MPTEWPLPLAEFWDTLPIQKMTCYLGRSETTSETGGGEVIPHAMGTRLWRGTVTLDKEEHAVWAAIEADLALLEQPGATFLMRDIRVNGPRLDPQSLQLGQSAPIIDGLQPNNRELSIGALPVGYELTKGDLLGFSYGANPTRYAYHRVVRGAQADVTGVAADIEVIPYLRPGAALGAPVTVGTPYLKARITSADYGKSRATVSMGASFEWVQTLR